MSERNRQFMKLYQEYRFEDQRKYYDKNSKEYKDAHGQVVVLIGVIMVFTAVAASLTAAVDSLAWKPVLTILAVVFPALSTALSAYNELFGFERLSKLYEDVERSLHKASADAPDRKSVTDDSEYDSAVGVYVNVVEGIFRKEQGQWGQLVSQAQTVELPAKRAQAAEKASDSRRASPGGLAQGKPDAPDRD
jgi:predicted nucleic acid-binding protein